MKHFAPFPSGRPGKRQAERAQRVARTAGDAEAHKILPGEAELLEAILGEQIRALFE